MEEDKKDKEYRRCTRGLWDTTVPGIAFDENGVSNYAKMYEKLCSEFPKGDVGKKLWDNIVDKMLEQGKNNKYDCILGVSGGTDSSYLMHIIRKEYNLRPLAVNLNNGWNSDIAVENIKKVTKDLDIDLETHVINYEEVKLVLRAYMRACLPWIDGPTDLAISSSLYHTARKEKIKYILNGSDFRTEGKQPLEWTYTDAKQMYHLLKIFENKKVNNYPAYNIYQLFKYNLVDKIKIYRPFYYLDYSKKYARKFLEDKYKWTDYGGHHHENIFTKFVITYWLPEKFNIDKRIITLSAQILNNDISRDEALKILKNQAFNANTIEFEIEHVLKKLDLKYSDFRNILNSPNKFYWNYPSYFHLFIKYPRLSNLFLKNIFSVKPSFLYERGMRSRLV